METTKILGVTISEAVRSLKEARKYRQGISKIQKMCTLMRTRKLLLMSSMAWTAIQLTRRTLDLISR